MSPDPAGRCQSTLEAAAFYRDALVTLLDARIALLVGGGYGFYAHTQIARMTKDFDIFLLRDDVEPAMQVLAGVGYRTELTFPHWLAKAYCGDNFIDLIFNSGNGCCPVDQRWFEHAVDGVLLDLPLKLCPPEEAIWQKAFIMERERYDGADVAHFLKVCGPTLDWRRLLERFADNWRVLLGHVVLFGFIYPGEQSVIPNWVMRELLGRLGEQLNQPPGPSDVCFGTVLSRQQFLPDVHDWGYTDARLPPLGSMTPEQIEHWTPNGDCPS